VGRGLSALLGGYYFICLIAIAFLNFKALRISSLLVLCISAQIVFIARVGKDWMPAYRFIVPVIPMLLYLMLIAFATLSSWIRKTGSAILDPIVFSISIMTWGYFFVSTNADLSFRSLKEKYVDAGYHLRRGDIYNDWIGPGHVVSSYDVGGQGYTSRMAIFDTAGLTEPIATFCSKHGKGPVQTAREMNCRELFPLFEPDIIREHANPHKDAWLRKMALATKEYVSTADNRFRFLRRNVLVSSVPEWATRTTDTESNNDSRVVAHTIPTIATKGDVVDAQLYWSRGIALASKFDRQLVLSSGSARQIHNVSNLWNNANLKIWRENELAVDFVRLTVPNQPGRWSISVSLNGKPASIIGQIDVFEDGPSEEDARAACPVSMPIVEQRRCEYHALKTVASYEAYQAAAVSAARAALQKAHGGALPVRSAALREALYLMRRVYWETEKANPGLCRAFDDIATTREALLKTVIK
jgi:hypothetical protein